MANDEAAEHSGRKPKKKAKRSKKSPPAEANKRGDSRYVYLSAATVMLPGFTVGTLMGWEHGSTMKNDSNVASVPFLYIGAIVGALIASYVMDRCGRHVCLWAFFWFQYVLVLARCLTGDVTAMCILRFVGGVSVGAYYQLVPIYIAELSYRRHRGVILAALGCFIAMGLIASTNSYAQTGLLAFDFLFGVAYLVMKCFYARETPYYDVASGDVLGAKHTLQLCRNADQWDGEIREITVDVTGYPTDVSHCLSFVLSFTEFNADFLHRTVTGAGLLLFSMAVFVTAHPGSNRYYYTTAAEYEVFFLQVVIVLFAFLVDICVIDAYGRKILLLISAGGVCLSYLLVFILYCAGFENGSLAIAIMRKFLVFYFYLGLDFIPFIYMSEIMPYSIRAAAAAFFLTLFFIAKSLQSVLHFYSLIYLDTAVQPLIYFVTALACGFFCWFIPPETKRLSLCAVQIQMDHDVTVFEDHLDLD